MNKKEQKQDLTINRIYLIILEIITVLFVVVLLVILINFFEPTSLGRMKSISAEELQNRKLNNNSATSFYVLVYNEDNEENEMIESQVAKYNDYAKKTDDAYPIFVLKYTDRNASIIDTVLPSTFDKNTEFPCLITIVSNSISSTKTTVSTILQALELSNE